MRTSTGSGRTAAGFTLLEAIFTIVLLGVFTQFAMMKLVSPATVTLPIQAQCFADLIRRAQSLAVVRGQRMGVSVSAVNVRVTIACATGTMPCNTDTNYTASQGVAVAVCGGSAATIYFNTL